MNGSTVDVSVMAHSGLFTMGKLTGFRFPATNFYWSLIVAWADVDGSLAPRWKCAPVSGRQMIAARRP